MSEHERLRALEQKLCAVEQRMLGDEFAEQLAQINTPADLLLRCESDSRPVRPSESRRRRLVPWFVLGVGIGAVAYQVLSSV